MEGHFRIDSHKLLFHVDRVNAWLKGNTICPIYMEIALSGGCNQRCIFCAVDYLNYKPGFLDLNVLKDAVKQAGVLGVKSIMFAGEGEPLLHREVCGIVKYTKACGIDVSITTNGVLLDKKMSLGLLRYLSWIRVSLNAGKSKTYAKIHRAQEEDFHKVLGNLKDAVEVKRKSRLKTTIGVQLLFIPENVEEVFILADLLRKIGVDYLTVKPYSQHPLSGSHIASSFRYKDYIFMEKKLRGLESKNFKIIFREDTMKRLASIKDYPRCLGLPFWAYIDASGNVYSCSAFLGKKEFIYGNIYKDSFKDIINSKRRKDIIIRISSKLNVTRCRQACRLDKINSYLWELKHPGPHVNFI